MATRDEEPRSRPEYVPLVEKTSTNKENKTQLQHRLPIPRPASVTGKNWQSANYTQPTEKETSWPGQLSTPTIE